MSLAASLLCLVVLALMTSCRSHSTTALSPATAAQAQVPARPAPNAAKNGYFGEQHLHTAYPLDAYIGGACLTPRTPLRQG
jgi:hypothetical protein